MVQKNQLSIYVAQLNPMVGAVAENAEKLLSVRARGQAAGADIVAAGELFLAGYPPEDLVRKQSFLDAIARAADNLAQATRDGGPALIFGLPHIEGDRLYNSVMAAENGAVQLRHKYHLPNYAVFDEKRLFASGDLPTPVQLCGREIGLPICEDIWFPDVAAHLAAQGAEILLVPNGSPFERDKPQTRRTHACARVAETGLPLLYINQFGGQDELVFDGDSFAVLPAAPPQIAWAGARWCEAETLICFKRQKNNWQIDAPALADMESEPLADIYTAAMIGLRDYVEKNRFPGVLLGLSGGIDSALCAAMAVDALGAARVRCVMLPAAPTSTASREDAAACAKALGVELDVIAMSDAVATVEAGLAPLFAGREADLTEENIQSRLRGLMLMAVSNKFGQMLVTTGNKSEVSVGYATLYGDMNGGYNPIKDIYKTEVFALAAWRNGARPPSGLGPEGIIIPQVIIDKPPSAELREGQKDSDSLPPYATLDAVLYALVEEEAGFDAIVARGHAPELVSKIEHLLYLSEYKRRQSAPGAKIGARNFGRARRYPITNGFREARRKEAR